MVHGKKTATVKASSRKIGPRKIVHQIFTDAEKNVHLT